MGNGPTMVTGGCGFVGAALVSRLLGEGFEVVILDDGRLGSVENLSHRGSTESVSLESVDLEDPAATRRALENHSPRVIYHLAALHFIPACNHDPNAAVRANVGGTQSLLDACRGLESLETVVIASSAAVYTPAPTPHCEEDATEPNDIYGLTKLWNEQQVSLFHDDTGGRVGVGIARLFNVYGPGETNEHLIPAIIRQGQADTTLRLGNLDTRRDYVFVEDVADALLRFPDAVKGGAVETCNVGTGTAYDGHQVVELIGDVLGQKLEVEVDPDRLRPSDRPNLQSDCGRAGSLLGWSAQTDFREGLAKAVALPLAPGNGLVRSSAEPSRV
jgi:UDP-glucose 4-epimerase